MARSRRGSSLVRLTNRRRTGWEEGPGVNTATAFSASATSILGAGQAFVADGATIVRLRGYVELVVSTSTAALDGFNGALGIGIVSTPAFTIGVTAVPAPVDEIEWEGWMWHQFFSIHSSTTVPSDAYWQRLFFDIDSKAMRKINAEETLMAVIQVFETGTATMSVRLATRMLLKLP